MPCDNFHPCRPGLNVEIGVPLVQPGFVQPGFGQPGYGGYPQQQMDPVRGEAFRVAQELRAGQVPQALNEIRQEVYGLPPREAERFARELQQATGGRSPLQERPEVVPGPQGQPIRTGNDVLVLTDPYRQTEQVIKQIHHDRVGVGVGIGIGRPGYPGYPVAPVVPGVGIGINIPLGGRRY